MQNFLDNRLHKWQCLNHNLYLLYSKQERIKQKFLQVLCILISECVTKISGMKRLMKTNSKIIIIYKPYINYQQGKTKGTVFRSDSNSRFGYKSQ